MAVCCLIVLGLLIGGAIAVGVVADHRITRSTRRHRRGTA